LLFSSRLGKNKHRCKFFFTRTKSVSKVIKSKDLDAKETKMKLITINTEQIRELHKKAVKDKKYSDKFFNLVWTHSEIVKEIAFQLSDSLYKRTGIKIDKDLLEVGALVHDIGVYFCISKNFNPDRYIYHGWEGEKFLRQQGVDDPLVLRFCSVHLGVGITKEDIKNWKLNLPKQDYIPISLEEEILTYADKFHTKLPKFVSFEAAREKIAKFGQTKAIKMDLFKKKFGLPRLAKLEKKYKSWHREPGKFREKIGF